MIDILNRKWLDNRALLITLALAVLVTATFWMGSRYPDLDEKAAMAGDTPFSALGFDMLIDMPPAPSVWVEIGVNAANWAYTNWKGMTFGLLAGALLLTLLPHFQRLGLRNRFLNSALGMAIGAPLGVCVNCATPVAQGAFAARARPETALAILVSSPTLNVVVVTMLLSLFPIYMALTKIVLTVLFILVCVPVITWLFPSNASTAAPSARRGMAVPFSFTLTAPTPRPQPAGGWLATLVFVVQEVARNLFYIAAITVPFMLLAGVLGAAAVTLVPFGTLENLLPVGGPIAVILAMAVLVLFGLFLPTPMALDVLIAAVLLQAGLPAGYAMTLLFALGIFSIYPFLMIWWQMSAHIAVAMTVTLAVLGVVGGAFVHMHHKNVLSQEEAYLIASLKDAERRSGQRPQLRQPAPRSEASLLAALAHGKRTVEPVTANGSILVDRISNEKGTTTGKSKFTRLAGDEIGLTERAPASYLTHVIPYDRLRSVASGDVHNDGWPDLVIASPAGLALYSNIDGEKFERQQIRQPELDGFPIGTVALIDLTNDGWLDLFIATVSQGTWMIENTGGSFSRKPMTRIPNNPGAIWATAPGFADIDRNGLLDVVLGNSTYGNFFKSRSHPRARNALAMQYKTGWHLSTMPASPGETLSTLLTDLNGDGWPDLLVGEDFAPDDTIYLNNGTGQLKLENNPTDLLAGGGLTTMSLTSADINNDLKPDLFLAQVARERHHALQLSPAESCAEIVNADQRTACVVTHIQREIVIPMHQISPRHVCQSWPDSAARRDCLAVIAFRKVLFGRATLDCAMFDDKWPALADGCRLAVTMPAEPENPVEAYRLPTLTNRNLLYVKNDQGSYQERADAFGLKHAGWAWNAKFADINNDEFQDLFVVTGYITSRSRFPTHFFQNQAGQGFEDVTDSTGLKSLLDILSYTYVDFDADGDLDIIAVPVIGPILVFRNDRDNGRSISFSLQDFVGNRSGIGSTVIIRYGDGQAQLRQVSASGGYLSFDAPTVHFGLGKHQRISRVSVTWSTGETTTVDLPLTSGAHYILTRKAR